MSSGKGLLFTKGPLFIKGPLSNKGWFFNKGLLFSKGWFFNKQLFPSKRSLSCKGQFSSDIRKFFFGRVVVNKNQGLQFAAICSDLLQICSYL
jgi:hypothetical protein